MLSNAIDFRTRRKQRPKSADFESVDEIDGRSSSYRSSSVTDILESVNIGGGSSKPSSRLPPRVLEGRNSAPDILPTGLKDGRTRGRGKLSAAATAKQKLSTRFQPQRKPAHRSFPTSSVKRAKTFNVGAGTHPTVASMYKTLPKQASSRSLGSSSSTDSSHSTASSRKSSNSSSLSDNSVDRPEISQDAMDEIEAFELFIEEYFQNCDNNNVPKPKGGKVPSGGVKKGKVSTRTTLTEVLELSI